MVNEIYNLLVKKDFLSIIKLCVKNHIDEMVLNEAIEKIEKTIIDGIESDYITFLNKENNIFSEEDTDLYGTDSIDVRNALGELYKTILGAMLVKHFANS